ncbi:spore germination protein [Cohnella faecalis]|uniref:Spore germination protein n=1 Tax=Cohnella faecalis TaxID=2315694 RepID=A0A398CBX0_9BACL|nr:spore germination protein [Cohnella faecalis]RIE00656.1 spore germination protein [Cohnella faecalis]
MRKKTSLPPFTDSQPDAHSNAPVQTLSETLDDNEAVIRSVFDRCSDLIVRRLQLPGSVSCMAVYLSVLIDDDKWSSGLLQPLMNLDTDRLEDRSKLLEWLRDRMDSTYQPQTAETISEIARSIVGGGVALFFESYSLALTVMIPNQLHRALEEPKTEAVIRGPRVGFIEKIEINLTLLRQQIQSPQLKIERMSVGTVTRTEVAVVYLDKLAPSDVVEVVKKRLSKIPMTSVLGTGYIEEMISDHPYSPFPIINTTERPDSASGSLMEGKVAVLVNGTPLVMIMPVTFWFGFQSTEDYYMNFIFATMLRWLRYLFAFFAIAAPSIYVAITTFHQEVIPTSLALSLATAREIVPFPTMVETLIMEVTFEALREAGVRLPRAVGQTISIVGALVIGQAAVQAGIISAPIIIVVSLTGIASFLIPQPAMSQAISILRFPMVICAGTFGLYGVSGCIIALLIHLANLHSFGFPYLWPVAPFNRAGIMDVLFRAPWGIMQKRRQLVQQDPEAQNP